MDVCEWTPPDAKRRYKLLALMDLATHFKAVNIINSYGIHEQQAESSREVVDALFTTWLKDKPKMKILVPDNAKTLSGDALRSTLSDIGIQLEVPPVKESWSHGMIERRVQKVKRIASKLALSFSDV